MTRIGLTLDEHFDLRVKPRAGADPAFHEAAQEERDGMFPMATVAASHHLRSRGYDCRPALLEALVEQGVVTPSRPDTWTQVEVDGEAVFEGMNEPGEVLRYEGVEEIFIRTGNAAALNVNYNGQDIGPMGERGEVVERFFTVGGQITPTPTPTITPTNTGVPTPTPRPTATPEP